MSFWSLGGVVGWVQDAPMGPPVYRHERRKMEQLADAPRTFYRSTGWVLLMWELFDDGKEGKSKRGREVCWVGTQGKHARGRGLTLFSAKTRCSFKWRALGCCITPLYIGQTFHLFAPIFVQVSGEKEAARAQEVIISKYGAPPVTYRWGTCHKSLLLKTRISQFWTY